MKNRKKMMNLRNQAGFTLIELMISLVLSSFVVAGGVTAMMAFSRMEVDLSHERKAGQQNRRGNVVLERMLGQAGYGIDPFLAFDPHRPDTECASNNGVCLTNNLDSGVYAGAVGADDLLFAARDPNYFALAQPDGSNPTVTGKAWIISSASTSDITLQGNGSSNLLPPGTVLLAICPGGYSYTLSTVMTSTLVDPGAGATVPLTAEVATDPFQQTSGLGSAACLGAGSARAFVINRYRFMIRQDNTTGRRYLFLSRSLDRNGDSQINILDWEVVSTNVDDLQAAYVMRDGTVWGNTTSVTTRRPGGNDASVAESDVSAVGLMPCSQEMTVSYYQARALAPCPLMTSPQRPNAATAAASAGNPEELWGNVKAVRLTLLTRTGRPMLKRGGTVNTMVDPPDHFSVEDHILPTASDGRPRYRLSSIIRLPNMAARGIPLI